MVPVAVPALVPVDIVPGVVDPGAVAPGVSVELEPGIVPVLGVMPGEAVPVVPGLDVPGMLIVPEPVVSAVPVLSVDDIVPDVEDFGLDLPVVLLVALLPGVVVWLVPVVVCEIAAPLASSEAAPKIKSVVRI